ncbi:MAG TPA: hypothetical protein PLD46_08170, partial [Hyphomicrobium sp.]|nr:hypothetical protein [Hyphomicrobium sp.]
IGGKLGKTIRAPQRLLLASDEFFKTILVAALTADYATRIAEQAGYDAPETEAYVRDRMSDQESLPYQRALAEAKRLLFQAKPGVVGQNLIAARHSKGPIGWSLRFIVPFVTTPANLIKIGLKKSPFGILAMGMQGIAAMRGDETSRYVGPRKYERMLTDAVEQVFAWSLAAVLYALTAPPDPDDPDDKDKWPRITGSIVGTPASKRFQQLNIPAMSFRVGDRWYSYARLEPFSTTLSVVIDALNTFSDTKSGKPLSADDAKKLLSLVRDKTYLQGIGDIIRGIDDPEEWVGLAQNFSSSWVPNLARQALRATDPLQRDNRVRERGMAWLGKSMVERGIQQAVPVPFIQPLPKYDHWGQPISKDVDMKLIGQPLSDIAWRIFVPSRVQRVREGYNIDRMIWNWNRSAPLEDAWFPGNLRPTVRFRGRDIEMNDEHYERFMQLRGEIARRLVAQHTWNFDKPTARDMKLVRYVFEKASEMARRRLMRAVIEATKKEEKSP